MAKYRIGYVDESVDEFKKFERMLRDDFELVQYKVVKELPLPDLIDQIYDSKVDLLLIDFLMVDSGLVTFNGDDVAREYEKIMPRFPMIIFTNQEAQAFPDVDDPTMIYSKNQTNVPHFTAILTRSIQNYQNILKRHTDIINALIEKGEKEGLSAEEKHTLLSTQLDLKNFDKRSVEVPYQLLNEKTIDDISKTRKDAEEYLKSLIEKNNEG